MSYRVFLKLQFGKEVTEHRSMKSHLTRDEAMEHRAELVQNFRRVCIGSEIRCEKPQREKRKRLRRRRR